MNEFCHHSESMSLDLELHLRCIVAALRLLSVHGIKSGTGTLTFDYFNELYNRMQWWYNFSVAQHQNIARSGEKEKNYNNEFLIVYARDLISSIPSDRTITADVASRMIAAAQTLGYTVVSKGIWLMVVREKHSSSGAFSQSRRPIQVSSFALAYEVSGHG